MINERTQKEIVEIIDQFRNANTELDVAMFLFATAISKLENFQTSLPHLDTKSALLSLEDSKNLLEMALFKFHQNRLPLAVHLCDRYLQLINSLGTALKV